MVQNKWNGKLYQVIKDDGVAVILKRCSDGSIFKIAKSEYNFSYKLSNKKDTIEK